MELIEKTGVPKKNPGDGLSAKEINAINTTVNNTVDVANVYLKDYCNANTELGISTELTLEEAISSVPEDRKSKGMVVRFLSTDGAWVQYSYIGSNVSNWMDIDNWAPGTAIDGGEW
jgi:hypothetical protein